MTHELLKGLLMFSFFQNLVLAGAAASLFYYYRKRKETIFILVVFFLLTAMQSITFYINNFSDTIVLESYSKYLLRTPIFIQPVLIYFFVLSFIPGRHLFKGMNILHLLPAVIFFIAVQLWFLFGFKGSNFLRLMLSEPVRSVIEVTQILGYSIVSGALLIKHKAQIQYYKWLMGSVVCAFLIGLAVLYGTYGLKVMEPTSLNPFVFAHIIQALMIFLLSLAVTSVFFKWEKLFKVKQKYSRTSLSDSEAHNIQKSIFRFIEEEQKFLDPGLKLEDLSKELGLSRFQISHVLNEYIGKNFYELVNDYRIKTVLYKLSSPEHKHENISEIAYSSGFNSIATFNRTFKAISGTSPSEYRKTYHPIG